MAGMMGSMSADRITVTVPEEVLLEVRGRVSAGESSSVSAFFTEAARDLLRRSNLAALLDDIERDVGPPTGEDLEWARAQLRAVRPT